MRSHGEHRIFVTTIGDLLLRAADRFSERPALIFPDCRHSYGQLTDAAYDRARSLIAHGVGPGDHVGILMANCLEYLELLLGCALIGAVAVPMNARYKPAEFAYVIDDADLKLLVTSDLIAEYADFAERLHTALPDLAAADDPRRLRLAGAPKLTAIVMLGSQQDRSLVARDAFEATGGAVPREHVDALRVRVRLEQPAIMMYTSGTTANPKGCPLAHGQLVRNGVNMNRERYFLDQTDVFWAPLPMFHMAAILPFLACLDAGAA
jgi:fatty-acyl-CoA synthase